LVVNVGWRQPGRESGFVHFESLDERVEKHGGGDAGGVADAVELGVSGIGNPSACDTLGLPRMARAGGSVSASWSGGVSQLAADVPVALVDDGGAELPGLDQVQPNGRGDGRQERRAATDDDGIAEEA